MKPKIKIAMLTMLVFLLSTTVCLAAETSFERAYVDSNSYSAICYGQKETYSEDAAVYISAIYTASGGGSLYSSVWCRATVHGEEVQITKGRTTNIPLPENYRNVGNYVQLQAKGNNPALDCQISGIWNVH